MQAGTHRDLMATSGEYLRIWEVGEDTKSVNLKSRLFNVIENSNYPNTIYRVNILNIAPLSLVSIGTNRIST
jgi:hypothetical protein